MTPLQLILVSFFLMYGSYIGVLQKQNIKTYPHLKKHFTIIARISAYINFFSSAIFIFSVVWAILTYIKF